MIQRLEQTYLFLFLWFFGCYPFFIDPWGDSYYYANAKAYYFMEFIFFLAALTLLRVWVSKNTLVWKWTYLDGLMAVFLFLIGLSTLFSSKPSLVGAGTEHQGLLIMLSCVLLFYLSSLFRAGHLLLVCKVMAISSAIASLYGILQHVNHGFLPQDAMVSFGRRSFSFFDNPDYFGSYLVLVIPVTVMVFLLAEGRTRRLLYFAILCIQLLALLETETRSAWLGSAMGFFVITFWVIRKRKRLLHKWSLFILAFCIIFIAANVTSHQKVLTRAFTIPNDIQKIISHQDAGSAGSSRWYIWQASIPLIGKHFWLGTGPNTFKIAFYSEDSAQKKAYLGTGEIDDANNNYLQIALTIGVPALLIYLLILYYIMVKGIRQLQKLDHSRQMLSVGFLAAITGYLVQSFFNINVVSVDPYLWLILGGLTPSALKG